MISIFGVLICECLLYTPLSSENELPQLQNYDDVDILLTFPVTMLGCSIGICPYLSLSDVYCSL